MDASLARLITRHLTAVGSILAGVTRGTSQVLFAGGQVVFLPFSSYLTIDSSKNEWNNFDVP